MKTPKKRADEWGRLARLAWANCGSLFKPRENLVIADFIRTAQSQLLDILTKEQPNDDQTGKRKGG